MEFFDCNASFGTPMIRPIRLVETAQELLKEMDYYGISKALVHHTRQHDDTPLIGNEILLCEIEGIDRLYGTLAVLPPQTGELGTLDTLLDKMKEKDIRAFWAFPSKHGYSMSKLSLSTLYDLMVERNVPLFIPVEESSGVSGWHLIENMLSEVPDLILVVTEHGSWGNDRFFRPLVERYENLYLDISRYELDGGIQDFCSKYGAERFLFGTGFPKWNPGGPILTLAQADITRKEREKISSGNLERILRRVKL